MRNENDTFRGAAGAAQTSDSDGVEGRPGVCAARSRAVDFGRCYDAVRGYLTAHPEIQFRPASVDFKSLELGVKRAMARNLAMSRQLVGLSQAAMATALKVSLSQYKKYESGRESLRIDGAQRWSLRFCLPFFYLLHGSEYGDRLGLNRFPRERLRLWFLANSLEDSYYQKLLNILRACAGTAGPPEGARTLSGMTPSKVQSALKEVDESAYIAVAFGLRAIRDHFGRSQEEVASLIGVSTGTYTDYERPQNSPRFSAMMAARYGMGTGVSPLVVLMGTQYAEIRTIQDTRMSSVKAAFDQVDETLLPHLEHLLAGFERMIEGVTPAHIARQIA